MNVVWPGLGCQRERVAAAGRNPNLPSSQDADRLRPSSSGFAVVCAPGRIRYLLAPPSRRRGQFKVLPASNLGNGLETIVTGWTIGEAHSRPRNLQHSWCSSATCMVTR
ncbi:hypothetical protein FALCPG4_003707 [Fusarium falciforme]